MPRPPGRLLLALARRALPDRDLRRIVDPAIADLQHEWSTSTDAGRMMRVAVRMRAYVGALRVFGARVLVAGVRGSVTPPSWPIARRVTVQSAMFLACILVVRALFDPGNRGGDHPLFYLPDWTLWHIAFLPLMWPTVFPRSLWTRATPLPRFRASDVAKLTAAVWILGLVGTGWVAPWLRQQYLASIGLAEWTTTGPHQWLLHDLLAAIAQGSAPRELVTELHARVIFNATTPINGFLSWMAIRRAQCRSPRDAFGHLVFGGAIVASVTVAASLALWPLIGQMAAEWLGLIAGGVAALTMLELFRLAEQADTLAAPVEPSSGLRGRT